jgi:hypothetical protein
MELNPRPPQMPQTQPTPFAASLAPHHVLALGNQVLAPPAHIDDACAEASLCSVCAVRVLYLLDEGVGQVALAELRVTNDKVLAKAGGAPSKNRRNDDGLRNDGAQDIENGVVLLRYHTGYPGHEHGDGIAETICHGGARKDEAGSAWRSILMAPSAASRRARGHSRGESRTRSANGHSRGDPLPRGTPRYRHSCAT